MRYFIRTMFFTSNDDISISTYFGSYVQVTIDGNSKWKLYNTHAHIEF